MNIETRLVLGTAQLGMPYGITNTQGKPNQDVAEQIIAEAWRGGIRMFDTAQAYGDSEKVLGQAFSSLGISKNAAVISKLPPELSVQGNMDFRAVVESSTQRLRVPALHCLMLHREKHLSFLDGALGGMIQYGKDTGLFRHFGVSVYTPEVALKALAHPLITALQVPANLFDRRFEQAGVFAKATELGKTIFVRSAMLQGILCSQPDKLPAYLTPLKAALGDYCKICEQNGIAQGVLALAWLLNRYPDSMILFGAETVQQIRVNLGSYGLDRCLTSLATVLEGICPPQDPNILNPANWGRYE